MLFHRGLKLLYLEKGELIIMTQVWDKEKIRVPDRNSTINLPNTLQALSTELQVLRESKVI